jgi:hypothetical protein
MITSTVRPARDEAADYYFKYIDLVPDGDVCDILETQQRHALTLFRSIPEERASHKYAENKWSISEVLAHLNDCERLFAFRAFWFARGFDSPLPSFDQEVAARHAAAEARSLSSHVDEFESLRAATVNLFRHLPADAWLRRGIASDNPFTVRALAYIGVGHVTHHTQILEERYL